VSINQPPAWQSDPHTPYIPISFEEEVVGFCQPSYANRIITTLNDEEQYHRALHLACSDLIARSQGHIGSVDELVQEYLAKAARPKRGAGLIALLLKERQEDLDLSDDEFTKFCDSYRLSPKELQDIYAGVEISGDQLTPLSRILGTSTDEIIEAWKGKAE
jgi:hypothetical protein